MLGEFPLAPRDQSARWYQLYREVREDIVVSASHRQFLLFRELAAMSLVLAVVAPCALYYLARPLSLWSLGIFLLQYAVTAVCARHEGARMVTNVLAAHANPKRRR